MWACGLLDALPFLHGDWKMGNLGSHPEGRTILIDCTYPGDGPACHDLASYLALDRAGCAARARALLGSDPPPLRRALVVLTARA